MSSHSKKFGVAAIAVALSASFSLAACGSGSGSGSGASGGTGSSSARNGTFTLAVVSSLVTDPSLANPPLVLQPAYDPLIHQNNDGSYSADLATKWGFTDSSNKTFDLTINTKAKFADGTALTAQQVAASINYVRKYNPQAAAASPYKDVVALNSDTVQVTYTKPVPVSIPLTAFSDERNEGLILGPKATADIKYLKTASDGIGPYVMDMAHTNAQQITYVPNDAYFNQSAIKFAKIVVEDVPNITQAENALKTGQVDYVFNTGDYANADAMKSAGFQVSLHGATMPQFILENRTSGSPLANLQVRQAMAYAIDRKTLMSTLYGPDAVPQSTMGAKGYPGYTDNDPYSYDLAKAKSLMAEAGYPNGFTVTGLAFAPTDPGGVLSQAIAGQLAKIGIKLTVTPLQGGYTQYLNAVNSRKYDVVVGDAPMGDPYISYTTFMGPHTTGDAWNLNSADKDVTAALSKVETSSASNLDAAQQNLVKTIDSKAWYIILGNTPNLDLASSKIGNVATSSGLPWLQPHITDPTGKEAFYRK
jgi:peptide/nickel transport system substrate-binding protein